MSKKKRKKSILSECVEGRGGEWSLSLIESVSSASGRKSPQITSNVIIIQAQIRPFSFFLMQEEVLFK